MPAKRCSRCSTNWPAETDYETCPKCRVATSYMHNAPALDAADAQSLKRHHDFDYYLEHETPERRQARQARDAAAEAAEIARLEAIVNGEAQPQEATA